MGVCFPELALFQLWGFAAVSLSLRLFATGFPFGFGLYANLAAVPVMQKAAPGNESPRGNRTSPADMRARLLCRFGIICDERVTALCCHLLRRLRISELEQRQLWATRRNNSCYCALHPSFVNTGTWLNVPKFQPMRRYLSSWDVNAPMPYLTTPLFRLKCCGW